jgi:hypothetical protein
MMTFLLICGAVLWILGVTMVWAICHVGKRGDRPESE